MAMFIERLKKGWNLFRSRDPTLDFQNQYTDFSYTSNPNTPKLLRNGNARTVVSSIYNQIAIDCSQININHVRLDDNLRFKEIINDSLNQALTTEANIDQTGRSLIKDAVLTMFDEGVVGIVPVQTDVDPRTTDAYNVEKLRVGRITEWRPKHVKLNVYDENIGERRDIVVEKRICAIIENPFNIIMNEPNSTVKRLVKILNQIDRANEDTLSGKADIFIQVPFQIKGEAKKKFAEERRRDIIDQLSSDTGKKYGLAYIDGTEKVIQLNRSLENNLWDQAKDLTNQLFSTLGFNPSILEGTADEVTMLNYQNRILEPIMTAITEEMERKWLSKTARTRDQGIRYFKDPFKLVPVNTIADFADKFTRNEIMSSNDIRTLLGMKPSNDPKADQLINANLNHPEGEFDLSVKRKIGKSVKEEKS